MKNLLKLLVAFFITFSASINAAEFKGGVINDTNCDKLYNEIHCITLVMNGEIIQGDSNRLINIIRKLESSSIKVRVGRIFLQSPGGSVTESMAIGRIIRSRQIKTAVGNGDTCASACVLILASGVSRLPNGDVIIHSFYSPGILGTNDFLRAEKQYSDVASLIKAYLIEMRASTILLDEMIRVPHNKMRTLEIEELFKFGLLGDDPVYMQTKR
jgi:hypothetical protein